MERVKKYQWMKIMSDKIITAIIIMTFLTLSGLHANSVFSFYGFPNQENNSDIYGAGMGETGIGDVFRKNTGYQNPSLSTTLNQVYFSTGILYGSYYYYDSQDNDFRLDGLHFPYFNMTVPLKRHRIGFDFAPILSGNTDVYLYDQSWVTDDLDYSYTEITKVRSYIYKGSFFYAYKHKLINSGFSIDYYLGHRFRAWSQEYTGAGNFINPRYEFNETFGSPGLTVGINKSMGSFSIGAMYRYGVLMEGKTELVSVHSVFDLGDSNFELPHKIGIGTAYRISDNYRLTSDLEYEIWSSNDYYDDPADTYKLGLGLAYEPYWGHEKWYQKIPLRGGGYYRTLPFQAGGNDLTETGFTFGFTLPLQSPNSQLDFSLKYMIRGDADQNGYQDKQVLFGIGLSGFDFFRSRPKRIEPREIPEAEFEGYR